MYKGCSSYKENCISIINKMMLRDILFVPLFKAIFFMVSLQLLLTYVVWIIFNSVTITRSRIETSIPRKHGPAIAGYESVWLLSYRKLLSLISRPLSPIFHFSNLTENLSVLQALNKFFENVLQVSPISFVTHLGPFLNVFSNYKS